jgi:hypothetical protein
VKNQDFTPKNHIFPILGGAREIFWVFHVKIHDFTPKKSYFYQLESIFVTGVRLKIYFYAK